MLCMAVPSKARDAQNLHVRQDLGWIQRNRVGENDLFNRGVPQPFDGGPAQNPVSRAGKNPFRFLFPERLDRVHQRAGRVDHVVADDDVSSADMTDNVQHLGFVRAPCGVCR